MITGVVNEQLEAVVSLEIRGPQGDARVINAVVDTGYNGYLSVPPRLVAELGLPYSTTNDATLADGRVVQFRIYYATVVWDGQALSLEVDEADTISLLGMALLEGCDLRIQVRNGGPVTIAQRP
ncbi:MAG: clan AA aspartic protease [Chloroflexota bacterium]|nr:clan AA aspartic protease [Chloroflexota bacterium]